MNTQWCLKCVCKETVHHINKPLFRLGRHRLHDIVCSSVVISREHANFIIESDRLYIKDLGSSNGTFVNAQRIQPHQLEELSNADSVSFGYPTHEDPCDQQGCFIYEVQSSFTSNDIINILEDKVQVQVKQEIEDINIDVTPENNGDNVNRENGDLEAAVHSVEEIDVKKNVKVELMGTLGSTELQNLSYSIEDNIIIITDDIDDAHELSSSQLFPIHDPYLKIKEELSEFDHVQERVPVVIESDDSSDFDIFQILMQDTSNAQHSNLNSNDLQNNANHDKNESVNANNFVSNNDVCNITAVSGKNLSDNRKIEDATDDVNSVKGESNSLSEHKNSKVNNVYCPTSSSGAFKSKYLKPPIIEPPTLVKPTTRSSRSKENKPETKRKVASDYETERNKKQRTSYNINSTPSTSKQSTNGKNTKTDILSKEDKLKIKQKRKVKLKEISAKPTNEDNEKYSKSCKTSINRPCVKVSKNRGEFMLDETSSSSRTSKKIQVIPRNLPKNSSTIQSTCPSKTQATVTASVHIESSTSNDPRLKNITSNNNVNTDLAIINDPKSNNFASSSRDGCQKRETLNNCTNIYFQPSFTSILNILSWRNQWLEEQKICPTYPPVNKRTAVKMCNSFANHNDYCTVVIPLLMIELWHGIYEDWFSLDTVQKQNQRKFSCIIQEVQTRSNYFILKCIAYSTKRQNLLRQHIRESNIVTVVVPVRKDQQDIVQSVFGFVANCDKRSLKGNDFVDEFLSRQLKPDIPESILHFDILIKPIMNTICLNKCMDGAILLSLVSSLRELDAVYSLGSSCLSTLILDPTVENYNISMKVQYNISPMEKLNEMQTNVVKEATALCLGDSPGIYLVQGPPGTGKTTVIKNIVKSIILDNTMKKKIRLLLTAPSNSAVDCLALKIIKELRARLSEDERKQIKLVRVGPSQSVHEEVKPFLLDQFSKADVTKTFLNDHPVVRRDFDTLHAKRNSLKLEFQRKKDLGENVDKIKEQLATVENDYECFAKNYMKQKYQKAFERAKRRVLDGSNIICTTLSSCVRLRDLNRTTSMECCIVDEATQSKEAETLIPLMLGVSKFILVGDPQQLPAVTLSKYAKELEHGQSLFQRVKKIFDDKTSNPIRMLNEQHRMHPEISYFPSNTFYKGGLKNAESCSRRDGLCGILPYYVFNLNLTYNQENGRNTNSKEMECVVKLLETIDNILNETKRQQQVSIGVITPYNSQKEAFLKKFNSCSFSPILSITVNTVDSFQGLEKDIIIVSCVRFTPNVFLGDEQRLNVALTRAKYALYIVGTYSLFKNCPLLNRLKADAERRKLYSNISAISTSSLRRIIKRH